MSKSKPRKIVIDTILCAATGGETVNEVVAAMIKLAKKKDCWCSLIFNGTKIVATPTSSQDLLVERYWQDQEE